MTLTSELKKVKSTSEEIYLKCEELQNQSETSLSDISEFEEKISTLQTHIENAKNEALKSFEENEEIPATLSEMEQDSQSLIKEAQEISNIPEDKKKEKLRKIKKHLDNIKKKRDTLF